MHDVRIIFSRQFVSFLHVRNPDSWIMSKRKDIHEDALASKCLVYHRANAVSLNTPEACFVVLGITPPCLTLRPLTMPAVSRFVVLCTCRSYISVAMRSHIEEISPAFPGNLKLLFSQHRVQVLRRQAWMEVSGIYLVTRYLAWRC